MRPSWFFLICLCYTLKQITASDESLNDNVIKGRFRRSPALGYPAVSLEDEEGDSTRQRGQGNKFPKGNWKPRKPGQAKNRRASIGVSDRRPSKPEPFNPYWKLGRGVSDRRPSKPEPFNPYWKLGREKKSRSEWDDLDDLQRKDARRTNFNSMKNLYKSKNRNTSKKIKNYQSKNSKGSQSNNYKTYKNPKPKNTVKVISSKPKRINNKTVKNKTKANELTRLNGSKPKNDTRNIPEKNTSDNAKTISPTRNIVSTETIYSSETLSPSRRRNSNGDVMIEAAKTTLKGINIAMDILRPPRKYDMYGANEDYPNMDNTYNALDDEYLGEDMEDLGDD